MSKTYLVASGKGGVGKSTVTACLAVLLARKGRRVVLMDADIGLRSQDLLLGLESSVVYDLVDVAQGRCLLSQALLPCPGTPNLELLPAAQFARCRDLDPRKLKQMLSLLRKEHDFILIDCPAGLERGLRNALNAGMRNETLILVTPDDLCIRGAERVAALIAEKNLPRPQLLVNRLDQDRVFTHEMYSAATISQVLDLPLLGEVPEDSAVYTAQLRHRLTIDYDCEARNALQRIAARLDGENPPLPDYGRRKTSFFRKHFPPALKEVPDERN